MIIAVASGKGGTGKTAIAAALALSVSEPVQLIDCDVEEPDAAIFLTEGDTPAGGEKTLPVNLMVPEEIGNRCTGCGKCADFCRFHAIVPVKSGVMIFTELCHACGGCIRICPAGALAEGSRRLGTLREESFPADDAPSHKSLVTGELDIGQPLAPPLIRAARESSSRDGLVIIDAPPGTSCSFVAAVRGADMVLLVAEPTPFGLHDLALAVEALRSLDLPFALIINKSGGDDTLLADWAVREEVKILVSLPYETELAEGLSRGKSLVSVHPSWKPLFRMILDKAKRVIC